MAKGIAINGQLRGKIGGTVYYRANGEQISRARNFKPNNPQTQSQMMQRLALANASKASKGLKEIIDHSFEGIRYGVDSVRHFESKCQLTLRTTQYVGAHGSVFTPFVPMDALGFPVADYLVSQGSLNSASGNFIKSPTNGVISGFHADYPVEGATLATLTPAQFCEALHVNTDSQLTFLFVHAEESIGGAGSEVIFSDNVLASIVRINFDQEQLNVPFIDENGRISASAIVADRSTNVDAIYISLEDDEISVMFPATCSASALIVSRYVDGMWRRSTEKLATAATTANVEPSAAIEYWGWNWLDEIQATLTKGTKMVEDRLLNKEPNSDIA